MKIALMLTALLPACAGTLSIQKAQSEEFMLPSRVKPAESEIELKEVTQELESLGYSFQIKQGDDPMTTTLYDVILLASDWESRSVARKVRVLRHELVHAKQWRKYGVVGFAKIYAVEAERWALEMHGHRQTVRDMCDMNLKEEQVMEKIDRTAERFSESYKVIAIPFERIHDKTRQVLLAEYESWEGCND